MDNHFVGAGFLYLPLVERRLCNSIRAPSPIPKSATPEGSRTADHPIVTKGFSFGEKARLQFRAETFNVCNHSLFAAPNVTPTSGAFGTISSTTNAPRVIQGALRLTF